MTDLYEPYISEHEDEHVYSVAGITREIKVLLESTIPTVWVTGEISNFTKHSSGHLYFSLKDADAQLACTMWRSRAGSLRFMPENGMKVVVQGCITVYEKRGSYQLDVSKIQPAGIGELQMAFEQLKQKLLEEGLFDDDHKKPIPPYPERIGIVTSPTGAAIQDLLNILNRRFPGVDLIINPVKVQGDDAAPDIARAIDEFNEYGDVDVLIVGRGGGSLEDLWAFNEEIVARAIYRSKIPVISAVGHEVDFSISDFVADLRAPTPSAAAELAVQDRQELSNKILWMLRKMHSHIKNRIQLQQEKLQNLVNSYSFRRTPDLIHQNEQRLDELTRSLKNTYKHQLEILRQRIDGRTQKLRVLAPESVLKRGYSICTRKHDGRIVRNANELATNDTITVKFHKGEADGTVTDVRKE
ncbi:exodeoxyribonuclease VII large subunit [candidate division KSB1 bacterium]|nr:exodeoxyribonuclease VII large subunit [candidate division KSB1 bacterium]